MLTRPWQDPLRGMSTCTCARSTMYMYMYMYVCYIVCVPEADPEHAYKANAFCTMPKSTKYQAIRCFTCGYKPFL